MIKEWNLLRVIACLSIVFLHSTSQIGFAVGFPSIEYYDFLRVILCFATPTFIVLSEVILSNRYQTELPKGFFVKRFKYIYSPFVVFAIIDGLVVNYFNPSTDLPEKIFYNIVLGTYEGYFILIIFQFYLLHYLVLRFKLSMKLLLPISLIVMVTHLYLLNNDPFFREYGTYLKLPATAWLAYFTIAFIIGRNYKKIAEQLKRYRWYTLLGVIFAIGILFISFQLGNGSIHSRRIDLFPLVLTFSLAVLAWGQLLPNFKLVNIISNYSLAIYLVHWQVQRFIAPGVAQYFASTWSQVLALFLLSLTLSMGLIKLVSLLPFGQFIVGNIKRRKFEKT